MHTNIQTNPLQRKLNFLSCSEVLPSVNAVLLLVLLWCLIFNEIKVWPFLFSCTVSYLILQGAVQGQH